MSTTPNDPPEHESESEPGPAPARPGVEAADVRYAFGHPEDQPRTDEAGDTAFSAVPPPLPTSDPAHGPIQDEPPGAAEQPQQSPYQQQTPFQPPQPQQQQPYGEQQSYGQQQPYGGEQYAGAQQQGQYGGTQYGSTDYGGTQYGSAGAYQAAPPPPEYGQPYGYPSSGLPPGVPPLADYGQRALAFTIDNGVAVVAGWITGATRSSTVDVVFGIIGLIGAVWAIIQAVSAGRTGQSYGKRVAGIRLARLADGQPVGAGFGFLRLFLNWLFWVLCIIPGVLNLLWPLWDARKQTWCDKIAKSVVVKTGQ